MAAGPCRNCGLKVEDEARACPHCGHPTRARQAAREAALTLPPLPAADPPAPPPLLLGAGDPARAPWKAKLGEMEEVGSRGGCMVLAAVAASLILFVYALAIAFGDGEVIGGAGTFAAAIALMVLAGGLSNFGLLSHVVTGIAFAALAALSAAAFYFDPSVPPALGLVVSILAVDYVWSVRKQLRTGKTVRFDQRLRPFESADPLPGAARQNALIELNNRIAEAGSVRAVLPEDVRALEAVHHVRVPDDLPGETRILYARYLRHFLEDDFLDDGEKEEIAALERLLRLPPAVRASVRQAIAAWLYEARAGEAMHDGRVDDHERALLDRIAADLELPAEKAGRIFHERAAHRLGSAAHAARADGVVTEAELAEVADMAAHLAVPIDRGIGGIPRAVLERFRTGHAPRAIPAASPAAPTGGAFAPHAGEVLHFQAPAERSTPGTPPASAVAGVVSITSHRMLFVAPGLRDETALGEIEGIRPRAEGVEIQQAGRPGRSYTFSHDPGEADLFVQTLSRAMRAASAGGRP